MEQFLVLSNSHKGNKIIDDVIKEVSNDLSNYSPRAQWMIPHQIARTKLISAIFYDFIIYESLLKPYKHTSTIMYKSNKQNKIIGYGLMTNHQINPMNSINDDENKYFVFIKLFITMLKYTLLTPLRIGFSNCFAIILFYYNQYLYNKSMFKNITKSMKQINNNNNTFSFISNSPNIIQLDYITILNNYRRQKNGIKLLKYLTTEIYDGYDEIDNNAPCIYIECNSNSLLFYRKLGFEIIGIIDNVYYNRNYRAYSMLYHKNTQKLNAIVQCVKQLFQQDNTLYINSVGLSFDFSDDDRSNIHFKWTFPPNNIMQFIIYLFKFGILTFFINKFERIFNFNSMIITNYTICQWIFKFLCLSILFWCCFPLLVAIILLRRFKIGAWDV
eukprot:171879_1